MRIARTVVGLAACILVSGSVFAQDWPQWRGAGRDAKVTDFKAPAAWPKQLTAKWTTKVGGGSESSPALLGDKLFVMGREGDNEVVVCLDAGDGHEVWRDKYASAAISGPDSRAHGGPRSSPAVADGKVVTLGVNGVVSCLNAADGKVLWRKDSVKDGYGVPRFHTASSPLIADGVAIVQLGGGGSGAVVGLDLVSGAEKWKAAGEGPGYASPALVNVDGTKLVVALTDKSIMALNPADSKQVWQAAFAPSGMSYNAVSPVVDGATVIYSGSARGSKAVKFAKDGEAITGKDAWSNADISASFCTPVLHEGLLFGLSAGAGRRGGGKFYCLDAKTGKTAWIDTTAQASDYGEMVDTGSAIIALTSAGQLTVLEPSDKAYKALASYKVSEKPTYGYPIVSGNRIFVRDDDGVMMFVLE